MATPDEACKEDMDCAYSKEDSGYERVVPTKCVGGKCNTIKSDSDPCESALNCTADEYCYERQCQKVKDACTSDAMCGGSKLCRHKQFVVGERGTCIYYLSLKDGDQVAVKRSDIQHSIILEGWNLLCRSGYADPVTGECAPANRTANRAAKVEADCDNWSAVHSLTRNGKIYCALLEGDREWKEALNKVAISP